MTTDASRVEVKNTPCFNSEAKAGALLLHIRVVRSTQAFRGNPADILRGILDIAGLTVDAVLGVNLKARFVTICDYFIHARWAVALSGFVVSGKVDLNRNRGVSQLQVAGLIFFMVGI